MILAIDIGNTNIVLGAVTDGNIDFMARISTDKLKTEDEYGAGWAYPGNGRFSVLF